MIEQSAELSKRLIDLIYRSNKYSFHEILSIEFVAMFSYTEANLNYIIDSIVNNDFEFLDKNEYDRLRMEDEVILVAKFIQKNGRNIYALFSDDDDPWSAIKLLTIVSPR